METKFTKGEWKVADGSYPSIIEVQIPNRMPITMVVHASDLDYQDSMEITANAHLIAAAPDMYEMLEELTGVLSQDATHVRESYIGYIDKLLAKARGEQ